MKPFLGVSNVHEVEKTSQKKTWVKDLVYDGYSYFLPSIESQTRLTVTYNIKVLKFVAYQAVLSMYIIDIKTTHTV